MGSLCEKFEPWRPSNGLVLNECLTHPPCRGDRLAGWLAPKHGRHPRASRGSRRKKKPGHTHPSTQPHGIDEPHFTFISRSSRAGTGSRESEATGQTSRRCGGLKSHGSRRTRETDAAREIRAVLPYHRPREQLLQRPPSWSLPEHPVRPFSHAGRRPPLTA